MLRLSIMICALILQTACKNRAATSKVLNADTSSNTKFLRNLAPPGFVVGAFPQDIVIDSAVEDQVTYRNTLAREFNTMTVGIYIDKLRPSETEFSFSEADKLVAFAAASNMRVRIHPIVWARDEKGYPRAQWLEKYRKNPVKLEEILRAHVREVVAHFEGKFASTVLAYDVVNEAIDTFGDTPRPQIWENIGGKADPFKYVRIAFEEAAKIASVDRLFLNEIFVEANPAKLAAFLKLAKSLKDAGVLGGVGIQAHAFLPDFSLLKERYPVFSSFVLTALNLGTGRNASKLLAIKPDKFEGVLRKVAELDLPFHLTELDLAIYVGEDSRLPRVETRRQEYIAEALKIQAEYYGGYIAACLKVPGCNGFVTWGVSDAHTWIPEFFDRRLGMPLLFDEKFQPKPAYSEVKKVLERK